jgi:hypothetical protein
MRSLSYRTYVLALLTSVALLTGATAARADQTVGVAADSQQIGAPSSTQTAPVTQTAPATQPLTQTAPATQPVTQTAPAAQTAPATQTAVGGSSPQPTSGQTDAAGASPVPASPEGSGSSGSTSAVAGSASQGSQSTTSQPGAGSEGTAPPDPAQSGSGSAGQAAGATQQSSGETQPSAAQSNTTTETIWQVQSLGCLAHCSGMTQTQSAQQQNITVQAAPTTAAAGTGAPTGSGTSGGAASPTSATNVTQIQIGCFSHCFGDTTTSVAGSGPPQQAIAQLLGSFSAPVLPNLEAVSAPQQNVVDQSSYQSQNGQGLVSSQTQTAIQTNATIQASGPFSWLSDLGLASGPFSAPGDSSPGSPSPGGPSAGGPSPGGSTTPLDQQALALLSPVIQVVNQVEQGIWQLQLGCLVFCVQTDQSQQAEQSDTTIWVAPDPAGPTNGTAANLVSSTYQMVWQLQIGCIFWCYDTVETQTATTSSSVFFWSPPPPQQPAGTPTPGGGNPAPADPGTPPAGDTPVAPPAVSAVGPPTLTAPTAPSGSVGTAPPGRLASPPIHFGQQPPTGWFAPEHVVGSTSSTAPAPAHLHTVSLNIGGTNRTLPGLDGVVAGGATETSVAHAGSATGLSSASTFRRDSAGTAGLKHVDAADAPAKTLVERGAQPTDNSAAVIGLMAAIVLMLAGRELWHRTKRRPVDLG